MNFYSPPKIACSLLHWALPAAIREQVIGDLCEEFGEIVEEESNQLRAQHWFWQQSIRTTLLYLWKEKGGLMAFVVSILIFSGMTAMAMYFGSGFKYYLDIPSLLLVFPPAVAFGIAASSIKAYKNSMAFAFVDQLEVDKRDAQGACHFLSVTGNSAMYMGFFTSMIGWVAMATNIKAEEFSAVIGPASAVSILTILYGMILKILCYTAENKIRFRYLNH